MTRPLTFNMPETLEAASAGFYVYAFIRKSGSRIARAGTPYYIGKGQKTRAISGKGRCVKRPDPEFVQLVSWGLTEEEAFAEEMELIDLLGRVDISTGILRNLTNGGDGPSGFVCPPETKEKLRRANLGKKQSSETIEKRRQKMMGRKGKPMGEAQKERLRQIYTGRKFTEDERAILREAQRRRFDAQGGTHPPEVIEKMRVAATGVIPSDDTRNKLSISQRKRFAERGVSDETREKLRLATTKAWERRRAQNSVDGGST
jgi:hypothetical protein